MNLGEAKKLLFIIVLGLTTNLHSMPCGSGKHLVREHIRSKNTKVKAYCRKNPAGYQVWDGRIKFGRPESWPNKNEKTGKWTEKEVKMLISAMQDMPKLLRNLDVKGIYRMIRSIQHPNSGANLRGNIVLYSNAFQKRKSLKRTLAHELSHLLYDQISKEKRDNYIKAMGWYRLDDRKNSVWIGRSDGYVEADGSLNPDEDFSNNIEYYMFKEEKLKKTSSKAWKWIKENYGRKLK